MGSRGTSVTARHVRAKGDRTRPARGRSKPASSTPALSVKVGAGVEDVQGTTAKGGKGRTPNVQPATKQRRGRRPRLIDVPAPLRPTVKLADGLYESIFYPFDPARYESRSFPIGFLNDVPTLASDLLQGLPRVAHAGHSPSTVGMWLDVIRRVIFAFAVTPRGAGLASGKIDRATLTAMWEHLTTSVGPRGRSNRTNWELFDKAQALLECSGRHDGVEWHLIPPSGDVTKTVPRDAPDPDDLAAIVGSCRNLLLLQMARHAALSDRSHEILGDPDERRIIDGARIIRSACRGNPPAMFSRARLPDELAGVTAEDYDRMCSVWCPTRADLLPAVVLTAFDFRLDGQLIMDARHDGVSKVFTFGPERTQIEIVKRRGGQTLQPSVPVDEEPDNPAKVIPFLKRWTKPLRRIAARNPRDADRIFVGHLANRTEVRPMDPSFWTKNIDQFLADHGLPKITFSQIRKGAIDTVSRLTHGDRALKAVTAGHVTIRTGDEHYSPEIEHERLAEAMAMLMSLRDRDRASQGVVDVRDATAQDDPMAATPGWTCSAPFDGPPGYRSRTVPCAAYGLCPTCDHGRPVLDSPYSCARVHDLRRAILASTDVPRDRWNGIWKPVVHRLTEHWIPMFAADPEVVRKAGELNLPPMMEVS